MSEALKKPGVKITLLEKITFRDSNNPNEPDVLAALEAHYINQYLPGGSLNKGSPTTASIPLLNKQIPEDRSMVNDKPAIVISDLKIPKEIKQKYPIIHAESRNRYKIFHHNVYKTFCYSQFGDTPAIAFAKATLFREGLLAN
jgi:hypothetical protein